MAALCDTLFPSLPDDARLARKADKDSIAVMFETSGRSVDFIVDEVRGSRERQSASYTLQHNFWHVRAVQMPLACKRSCLCRRVAHMPCSQHFRRAQCLASWLIRSASITTLVDQHEKMVRSPLLRAHTAAHWRQVLRRVQRLAPEVQKDLALCARLRIAPLHIS